MTHLFQDAPDPVSLARARSDENSLIAHEQLLQKAQAGRIDLYFLGDSITRRWGSTDPALSDLMDNWIKHFYGWNAANFGWGADTIENIIWRIHNGELDNVNPKVIVIQCGTNNLGNQVEAAGRVRRILNAYTALLALVCKKAPAAEIILNGIFPRSEPALLTEINQINDGIATLAHSDDRFQFVNIYQSLSGKAGLIEPAMTTDGLHLSAAGYDVWAAALLPLLKNMLGERAKTDNAPPPTGDPSIHE